MSEILTKRGAEFPLEKLCFEREHVGLEGLASTDIVTTSLFKARASRPYRAGKKLKLSLSRVPEEEVMAMKVGRMECGARELPSGNGCRKEALNSVDAVSDGTPWGSGCWLAFARRRAVSIAADQPVGNKDIAAPSGRPLVQLKIDAMFASLGTSSPKAGSRPGKQPIEDATQDRIEAMEGRTTTQGVMDVDTTTSTTVVPPSHRDEGVAACYVCTGGLGKEGGDILCAFCDRGACQTCWVACAGCEIPHCSLCLAADYRAQFERHFCPSCSEDRQRDGCHETDGMVMD